MADATPHARLTAARQLAKRSPSVTAVIPVLGDQPSLEQLLRRIAALQPGPDQALVVDGASDPACAAMTARHGCGYLAAPAGRGQQLDAGARRSHSEILWFVHADAAPPPDAITQIANAIAAGANGGYFRFRFRGPDTWYKRWLAKGINWRASTGVPYGDQGLFMLRKAYLAAGGFSAAPLFEEVALVRALRQLGDFVMLDAAIGVSPRRWERDGWIRRTLGNRLLAAGHMLGIPAHILARRYSSIDSSERP